MRAFQVDFHALYGACCAGKMTALKPRKRPSVLVIFSWKQARTLSFPPLSHSKLCIVAHPRDLRVPMPIPIELGINRKAENITSLFVFHCIFLEWLKRVLQAIDRHSAGGDVL
jgi:hypothetical protein